MQLKGAMKKPYSLTTGERLKGVKKTGNMRKTFISLLPPSMRAVKGFFDIRWGWEKIFKK